MTLPLATLVLSLLVPRGALAADTCLVEATQWLQDGALRAAADGPVLAQAHSSPELLAVQVELSSAPAGVRVHLEDSTARVDAWMALDDLRVRAQRPLSFADDTIFLGQADLMVRELSANGIKVAPMELPGWVDPDGSPSATVACGDLSLVDGWPGDMRPLAVGSAGRGDRVWLKGGEHIELSRIPGSSSVVTLHPLQNMAVEAVSKDGQAVRIVARFDGGLVVGWVPREAVTDEAGEPGETPASTETTPSSALDGETAICKKGAPLWVSTGGQDHILGTLEPGVKVIFGERSDDRVTVLAVPGATTWGPSPEASWWLDAKTARGCK